MATHTYLNIDIPEASYLSDLTGIEVDLRSTIDLCKEFTSIRNFTSENMHLVDALSTAIVVRYSRSFSSGIRKSIDIKDVNSISDDLLTAHKKILNIRNKHIAHSVNAFEENQVVGYYIEENPDEKGIISISSQHGHYYGINHNDAVLIIKLAELLLEYTDKLINDEKSIILNLVRKMNINDLISTSSKKAMLSGVADPGKNRKQKNASNK